MEIPAYFRDLMPNDKNNGILEHLDAFAVNAMVPGMTDSKLRYIAVATFVLFVAYALTSGTVFGRFALAMGASSGVYVVGSMAMTSFCNDYFEAIAENQGGHYGKTAQTTAGSITLHNLTRKILS